MPAFFVDREECMNEVSNHTVSSPDGYPSIETLDRLTRGYRRPNVPVLIAKTLEIDLPEGETL